MGPVINGEVPAGALCLASRSPDGLSPPGCSYDWKREISTTDEKYYKWTQWIFLQLYEKGLAYQAEAFPRL